MNISKALGYFNNTNKSIIVLLSDENKGLIDISIGYPCVLCSGSKDKSSKKYIAAIVICCGLALIATLIIVILCRRQHPDQHPKVLKDQSDFNSFNKMNLYKNN